MLVNPERVVGWHRAGFRRYWSWISKARKQVDRKKLALEVRELKLPYDGGEPDLGRASHSRRTAHAGLPAIRAKSLSLDEASSEGSPASPALARLSSESQGSDCGHGLLHRAHDQLRRPLLLLCHPPRSPARIMHFNITKHPPAVGSSSSCGRRFRLARLPDF